MRLAISGTENQGKTTLINDFLNTWKNYSTPDKTYKDLLKDSKINKDLQWNILNSMVDEMQKYDKNDNVIFNRCPLDNLVYTLYLNILDEKEFDNEFVEQTMQISRESLKHLDIIFFIPISKYNQNSTNIKNKEKTLDSIFKGILQQQLKHPQTTQFFPRDDTPPMIEIFGNREERIQMIKLYLDNDGDLIGGEGGLDEVFKPEELQAMEALLENQKELTEKEKAYKEEIRKINEFYKQNK